MLYQKMWLFKNFNELLIIHNFFYYFEKSRIIGGFKIKTTTLHGAEGFFFTPTDFTARVHLYFFFFVAVIFLRKQLKNHTLSFLVSFPFKKRILTSTFHFKLTGIFSRIR